MFFNVYKIYGLVLRRGGCPGGLALMQKEGGDPLWLRTTLQSTTILFEVFRKHLREQRKDTQLHYSLCKKMWETLNLITEFEIHQG